MNPFLSDIMAFAIVFCFICLTIYGIFFVKKNRKRKKPRVVFKNTDVQTTRTLRGSPRRHK